MTLGILFYYFQNKSMPNNEWKVIMEQKVAQDKKSHVNEVVYNKELNQSYSLLHFS